MKISVVSVDISDGIRTGQQPVVVYPRPEAGGKPGREKPVSSFGDRGRVGVFYAAVSRVPDENGVVEFSLTKTGDFVRVPMFNYDITGKLAETVDKTAADGFVIDRVVMSVCTAVGFEIGVRAAAALWSRESKLPVEAIIVAHKEVKTIEGGWRAYAGVLFRTDKQQ